MVRWPGASMAPVRSTWACRQTESENKRAKVLKKDRNNGGKDNKQDHFPNHLHTTGSLRNGQSRGKRVATAPQSADERPTTAGPLAFCGCGSYPPRCKPGH